MLACTNTLVYGRRAMHAHGIVELAYVYRDTRLLSTDHARSIAARVHGWLLRDRND